jgi:hypothetical protein
MYIPPASASPMHNNDGVAKTVIEHGGVTIDIDFSVIGPTIRNPPVRAAG